MSRQGTVAGYGMVARESLQPGELLFAVPRAALLSPRTCSIRGLLERGGPGARGGAVQGAGLGARGCKKQRAAAIKVFRPVVVNITGEGGRLMYQKKKSSSS